MMRKFVSTMLLLTLSTGAMALGLGNIQLNSGLNQPFDARIELLSPTASEIESLTVRLADPEAFSRAGIDRAFVLTTLRFEVQQNEAGSDYIQISSREVMREPFLNFLIEASWSSGKLFREYTVLLDPPLYDPNAGRQIIGGQVEAAPLPQAASDSQSPAADTMQFSGGQAGAGFSGSEVGPVSASETLWSVASRTRPDESVSVNQMMLALLRANPEAFINNNINGLKQGQILRIPELDEINATSYQAALEEVRAQNAMWEDIRAGFASSPGSQPAAASTAPAIPSAPVSTGTVSGGSELRLLAAGDQSASTGQTGGPAPSAGSADSSIDLLDEQVQSLSAENAELRDRLTESDQIIQDLRRLIELRDDELAAMQQQLGGASAGEQATEPAGMTAEGEDAAVTGEISGAGPETVTTENVDQAAGEPAEVAGESVIEQAAEEQAPETAEPSVEEDAAEPAEEQDTAAEEPVEAAAPMLDVEATAAPGLVDTLLEILFGNIMLIGGAIVAIILAALVPIVIRKRREAAAEAEQAAPVSFPDFETADAAAGPETDGPQIDIDIDSAGADESPLAEVEPVAAAPAPVAQRPEPAAPAPAAQEEEDPLAEVNVFLAYEHFDQAEEFVRDAITRQPNNLDFHSKLLEVFYSAGERAKYEEEAKILHDLTGGSGPHWDMATIMWQEMSPNRALFAEPAEGEESRADTGTGGGIVDLTADDAAEDDAGIDFDLGAMEQESAPAGKTGAADGMLDITAGSGDVLDVTASESGTQDEDILDVTAAVGLDVARPEEEGLSLDLPGQDEQDILDISASGTDDPLDVTAHTDLEAGEEDLLDVTMTGRAGSEPQESGASAASDADNLIDFDIGGLSAGDSAAAEESQQADGIELDFGTDQQGDEGDSGLSLDSMGDAGDGGIELDFGTDQQGDEGDTGLTLDGGDDNGDGGIELDFSSVEEGDSGADTGLSLDLQIEHEPAVPSIDMDSTVKIPKQKPAEITLDDLEDDDEGDHTVFVARTGDVNAQSSDDENATKLDLAKAYVELGDQENAKSILEEVIAGGNAAQRRQAQELMAQIG